MKLINQNSLALTLDAVDEAFFYRKPLVKSAKIQVAKWIATRQGMPDCYADMFAPTRKDFQNGVTLFTGEKVSTRAGLSHILGQEACRTLIRLDVNTADVNSALKRASTGITNRMGQARLLKTGMYCCAVCSCSLWRHLSAGGLENGEDILTKGIRTLKAARDGNGRWTSFPFYYTLLVLSEMELPVAKKEIQYAAPSCERVLRKTPKPDKISQRRHILVERILEKC